MMNYTRIICTIGPGTLNERHLRELHKEGLSVVRLNGSHSDLDWHQRAITKIRSVLPNIPILLDLPGRKIRTGQLKTEPRFEMGETIILTTESGHDGTLKVPVNYPDLHLDVKAGHKIMADDGTIAFTVERVDGRDIHCRAETSGQLKSRKGISVPWVTLNTPLVTERDVKLIAFACENEVDFVGLSFVESAQHIELYRNMIKSGRPRIVAKVENQGGVQNLREIVQTADAIMIDRGDLSVETSLHDVVIKQKNIIAIAKEFGCPVIVATEMLHSMVQNSFPTKAEISDITNAVLDGCSATMLSGETAAGAFPVEAVKTMRKVIEAAEGHKFGLQPIADSNGTIPNEISKVIPLLCQTLPVTKILIVTRTGYAAKLISSHGLPQPIIAVTDDEAAARSFNLIAGTLGVFAGLPFQRNSADHVLSILHMLYEKNLLCQSDIVLAAGVSYPGPSTRMNMLQIHKMSEVLENKIGTSTQREKARGILETGAGSFPSSIDPLSL
jgi:pyruvate kinase